ncbi:hypothetical protein H2O64_23440 [Kordia sp. YSTF-M3]|uniref:Uncharacterized protein n=1 Tax=Kordia aestuariivivens TaxID=2759037 RepID=A0ABR7QGE0_9FLAO|nr:hypothetical protein [Kordia aestuariivivens]MBC8757642.1 hypothetical protein [Kordia aestuariivivens]
MIPQEDKIKSKQFLIKIYPNLLQIEKVIRNIVQHKNGLQLQVSILGKLASNYSDKENALDEKIKKIRWELAGFLGKHIQFGYFNNSEIGILFIVGHLTETFLCKIDGKELGSLPIGLFGIFRGIGIKLGDINRYIKELQNANLLLIIRGEKESLIAIENLM